MSVTLGPVLSQICEDTITTGAENRHTIQTPLRSLIDPPQDLILLNIELVASLST